ncbi:MAG: NAD-dependent epimerase/dehydratase family protein [Patescibacteria group bacterium]|jgi:UDP-glucose 4-epimerase
MARILVTGGAGFIGSHLVDALIKKNHHVTVVDDLSVGKRKFVNGKAAFCKIKIQSALLKTVFQKGKFDYVFHLAAQKNLQYSKSHPVEDAETNILGSLNVITESVKHHVKKIVFYSTAAVYNSNDTPPNRESDVENPATPYGIAKYTIEKYLQASQMNYSIMRLSNVYGPRQDSEGEGGVVAIFCKKLAQGKPPYIFNSGNQTRDFIFVGDVVRASLKALTRGKRDYFNVSTDQETTINKLFATLSTISKQHIMPYRGKKVQEQCRSALANTKAKRILGWFPKTTLATGLKETYHWFIL